MDTINAILENGGYQGMLALTCLAVGYFVVENRSYKKDNKSLNETIRVVLEKSNKVNNDIIAGNHIDIGKLTTQVEINNALLQTVNTKLDNMKKN